jgi:hypothetical protein
MTSTTERTATGGRVRTTVRVGLWFLAAVEVVVGVWAQFFPESFYADFPLGRGWVALLPPYNEHLVRDVGGLSLALVAVLVAAAVRTDRWTVRVAAVAMALFSVPHTVFHQLHLEHFAATDAVVQSVGNVLVCLVAVGLWVLAGRLPARG